MDSATGAPLFRPAVGRAPLHARNASAKPVGDYLYNIRSAVPARSDPSPAGTAMSCLCVKSAADRAPLKHKHT